MRSADITLPHRWKGIGTHSKRLNPQSFVCKRRTVRCGNKISSSAAKYVFRIAKWNRLINMSATMSPLKDTGFSLTVWWVRLFLLLFILLSTKQSGYLFCRRVCFTLIRSSSFVSAVHIMTSLIWEKTLVVYILSCPYFFVDCSSSSVVPIWTAELLGRPDHSDTTKWLSSPSVICCMYKYKRFLIVSIVQGSRFTFFSVFMNCFLPMDSN